MHTLVFRCWLLVAASAPLLAQEPLVCETAPKDCSRKCDDGDARACFDAGQFWELKGKEDPNLKKAAEFYTSGCEAASPDACASLGAMIVDKKTPGVTQVAFKHFKAACKGGIAWACDRTAQMYLSGSSIAQDRSKAVKDFSKACRGGFVPACTRLGGLHCEDDAESTECKTLTMKSCDAPTGCSDLAQNIHVAGPIWARFCEEGNTAACQKAMHIHINLAEYPGGTHMITTACKAGVMGACFFRGESLLNGVRGYKKDEDKAVGLLEKAAAADHLPACRVLGLVYLQGEAAEGDPVKAESLLTRACDGDDAHACMALGWGLARGKGVKKDGARGRGLLKKGCSLGRKESCGLLQSAISLQESESEEEEKEEEDRPKKKKKKRSEEE